MARRPRLHLRRRRNALPDLCGLDWSETLTLFMVALASGVVLAFFGLKLIEALSYRLTGRSERKRIRQQIEGLKGRG